MSRIQQNYDVHQEMIVKRFRNGIHLVKPEKRTEFNSAEQSSVKNLFASNLRMYFVDHDSVIRCMNEGAAEVCGFTSVQSGIGTTCGVVLNRESFELVHKQDRETIHSQTIQIRDHIFTRSKDNLSLACINFKYPWYNQDNQIIGVFGFGILNNPSQNNLYTDSVSETLTTLISLGLLNTSSGSNFVSQILPGNYIGKTYFTKREVQVIHLLVQGKTAKKIGLQLGLSFRTVEFYYSNIKKKLGVTTKSEAIDKIINQLESENKLFSIR